MKTSSTVLLRGTSANDTFKVPLGRTLFNTSFDGGRGTDTLDLTDYVTSGVTIRLIDGYQRSQGSVITDRAFTGVIGSIPSIVDSTSLRGTITSVESLIGSKGNDFLSADMAGATVTLNGGLGNDALQTFGNVAAATLIGGLGNDWFDVGTAGSILIGGTVDATGAHGDGEYDVFRVGPSATIRDFEVGIDRLLFSSNHSFDSAYATGTWVPDNAGGSTFMVGGQAKITLNGVAPEVAASIAYGFEYLAEGGVLHGSTRDDVLHAGLETVERVVVGSNGGNDLVIQFDRANDVIQFAGDLQPVWSDTYVNGQQALMATYAGGSLTLTGLTTGDVPFLHVEGFVGPASYGVHGPGSWSVPSDASFF